MSATPAPAPVEERPAGGLVTLVLADTSRPRAGRAARRGSAAPGAPGAPSAGPRQWSCSWFGTGPGPVSEGCSGEPDLTLTLSPADAELIKQARLSPSVAFMQGRLKTSGDNALLLALLAWSATDAFPPTLAAWSSPTAAP